MSIMNPICATVVIWFCVCIPEYIFIFFV